FAGGRRRRGLGAGRLLLHREIALGLIGLGRGVMRRRLLRGLGGGIGGLRAHSPADGSKRQEAAERRHQKSALHVNLLRSDPRAAGSLSYFPPRLTTMSPEKLDSSTNAPPLPTTPWAMRPGIGPR